MGCNIFNNGDLDLLHGKIAESSHDFNENEIILVKFDKGDISFLILEDENNYKFEPSKNIEIIKNIWFEGEIPKQDLYEILSKLSELRTNFHTPEYFENKLKKVYFKYINNKLVPYRYSLTK